MLKWLWRFIKVAVVIPILMGWYIVASIYIMAERSDTHHADAAVVLGAAAWGSRPSPIFRERINHALRLYESGQVERIMFTGGDGVKSDQTEAAVARNYAIEHGVPAEAILVEEQSANTVENLRNIQPIMAAEGIESVLLVSTPYHMRRVMFVADRVGLDDFGASPTRSTVWLRNGSRPMLYTRELVAWSWYRYLGGNLRDDPILFGDFEEPQTPAGTGRRPSGQ